MDTKEVMILAKGEDKTEEICNICCDFENRKVNIIYRGCSTVYKYDQNNVIIIIKPEVIKLDGQAAYIEGMPVYEPQLILDFGEWIRIIQYNGKALTIRRQSFSLVRVKNGDGS